MGGVSTDLNIHISTEAKAEGTPASERQSGFNNSIRPDHSEELSSAIKQLTDAIREIKIDPKTRVPGLSPGEKRMNRIENQMDRANQVDYLKEKAEVQKQTRHDINRADAEKAWGIFGVNQETKKAALAHIGDVALEKQAAVDLSSEQRRKSFNDFQLDRITETGLHNEEKTKYDKGKSELKIAEAIQIATQRSGIRETVKKENKAATVAGNFHFLSEKSQQKIIEEVKKNSAKGLGEPLADKLTEAVAKKVSISDTLKGLDTEGLTTMDSMVKSQKANDWNSARRSPMGRMLRDGVLGWGLNEVANRTGEYFRSSAQAEVTLATANPYNQPWHAVAQAQQIKDMQKASIVGGVGNLATMAGSMMLATPLAPIGAGLMVAGAATSIGSGFMEGDAAKKSAYTDLYRQYQHGEYYRQNYMQGTTLSSPDIPMEQGARSKIQSNNYLDRQLAQNASYKNPFDKVTQSGSNISFEELMKKLPGGTQAFQEIMPTINKRFAGNDKEYEAFIKNSLRANYVEGVSSQQYGQIQAQMSLASGISGGNDLANSVTNAAYQYGVDPMQVASQASQLFQTTSIRQAAPLSANVNQIAQNTAIGIGYSGQQSGYYQGSAMDRYTKQQTLKSALGIDLASLEGANGSKAELAEIKKFQNKVKIPKAGQMPSNANIIANSVLGTDVVNGILNANLSNATAGKVMPNFDKQLQDPNIKDVLSEQGKLFDSQNPTVQSMNIQATTVVLQGRFPGLQGAEQNAGASKMTPNAGSPQDAINNLAHTAKLYGN